MVLQNTSAHAEWRAKIGVFKIGLVSQEDRSNLSIRLEPFRIAIQRALNIDVELFPVRSEKALIQALDADRIEYAILSSSGYALASAICDCVEPLVTARAGDSSDGYHTVVITNADRNAPIDQLQNLKLGSVKSDSISGLPFARFMIAQETETNTPLNVIEFENGYELYDALEAGDVDAIIGWSSMTGDPFSGYSRGTLRQLADRSRGDASAFKVVWQSPAIPYKTHLTVSSLDGEAKRILREKLTAMYDDLPTAYDAIEPDHSGGFVVTRPGRFKPLVDFLDQLHPKSEADAL